MKEKITAGRDQLGDFAPDFARYNDDVLFGEIWESDVLSDQTKSMITLSALITKGATEQLPFHLKKAKANGINAEAISALITHLAFYVGWPNAWSAFNIAKRIYQEEKND
ncbi:MULTISPECIES: carboxymuconolactone decarboxylase family protein [unclassified Enterococcus]|uniref:carboxymuconolactone decarboxylase family protein n=1 Tax=unclassified Enterococcus TaxID=2608891 RepID=UPI001556E854|nr:MULTISPECIES: carboxymuconolactone decarboxylase family protein [unclassified Enterococcus]MBS7576061.1 carboxymuconolactone decarboxylase family protein [Enterococcus sp. MMGLQ5-2]MBS7583294.1 carboxymuconolactone decarboxylase family protein [Enterococcus sp. MMGLQ5-1]NPD11154.1 carboxymuconolactone decarboxylase family protein [Enterococcus sp. MMGLQ5-1]NPD35897.1 carboxymuconolactone decarboxylase family protein [Enterococcus sp. MMGLQ5-2]